MTACGILAFRQLLVLKNNYEELSFFFVYTFRRTMNGGVCMSAPVIILKVSFAFMVCGL